MRQESKKKSDIRESLIASAYLGGTPPTTICGLLQISRKTLYAHLAKAGIKPGRKYEANDDGLLGPDIPYIIQISCGVPCHISVQWEGGCPMPQPEPEEIPI